MAMRIRAIPLDDVLSQEDFGRIVQQGAAVQPKPRVSRNIQSPDPVRIFPPIVIVVPILIVLAMMAGLNDVFLILAGGAIFIAVCLTAR